jgi:hypothetical protein
MPEYEVTISESVAPGGDHRASSPMVRTVDWRGEASSEDTAQQAAWRAWDHQYGAERERPEQAEVHVTKLSS